MLFALEATKPTPCAGKHDLMFDDERVEEAKALCAGCPFTMRCREFGETQEYGVWGGVQSFPLPEEEPEPVDPRTATELIAERDARVMELLDGGMSKAGIARELGMTRTNVIRVVSQQRPEAIGKASHDGYEERREAVLDLWDHEAYVEDIAFRLRMSATRVRAILRKHRADEYEARPDLHGRLRDDDGVRRLLSA